jgi:hypothetical protein
MRRKPFMLWIVDRERPGVLALTVSLPSITMVDFSTLNYGAILVAALAAFFVGFMWHGPVFGKVWVNLMKITPQEMEAGKKDMAKKMPLYMFLAFLQQVVTATVVAILAPVVGVSDAVSAILFAILLWLGFFVTTQLNAVLWEKRSVNLYLFEVAYHLVSLIVIALIIGLWR